MDLRFLDAVGGARVVIGVVVALLALVILKRLMRPAPAQSNLNQQRTCGSCGWEGTVSRHKPRCPKCANSL